MSKEKIIMNDRKVEKIRLFTEAYKKVVNDLYTNGTTIMSASAFNFLFAPLRTAAKDAGLTFRKGCIYTKNNKNKLPFFPIPEKVSILAGDLGNNRYFWSYTQIVCAAYNENKKEYTIVLMDTIGDERFDFFEKIDEIRDLVLGHKWPEDFESRPQKSIKHCVSAKNMLKLFLFYTKYLVKTVAIAEQDLYFMGWFESDNKYHYLLCEGEYDYQQYGKLGIFDTNTITCLHMNNILFSLTVFSITKTLLAAEGLPVDFSIQFRPYSDETLARFLYYVPKWVNFFCNPNHLGQTVEKCKLKKYYKGYHNVDVLNYGIHHHFPLLFLSYEPLENTDRSTLDKLKKLRYSTLSKVELEKLQKATCAPILLQVNEPSKPYPPESCLSIKFNLPDDALFMKYYTGANCDKLFSFYREYIVHLNNCCNTDSFKHRIREHYKTSLSQIDTNERRASPEKAHIACIIVALSCLTDWFNDDNFGDKDTLNAQNTVCKAKDLWIKFGKTYDADEKVFAEFIKNAVNVTEKRSIVFCEDDDYVYLYYKEYWDAFKCYCKEHDISVNDSAAGFRRKYLAKKYIKPQYEPKPGEYARYDYRKKKDDEEAAVLAVRKSIFLQIQSPIRMKS